MIFAPDLPHQTRFSQPLRYPYFRPPNIAFDERVRQASLRLEAAGVVTRTQLAEARARYDVGMIDNYRFKTNDDRLFLEAQARRCDGIVKGYLREPIADLRSRYVHG